jgi:hypothetical protein
VSAPTLRIVRGDATPEEMAAIVAVLASRRVVAAAPAPSARSAWADRSALLRRPLPHGPAAWRASALPR